MHKYDICDRFAISRAFLRAHNAPDGSPQDFHKFTKIFPQKMVKDISTKNGQRYFHKYTKIFPQVYKDISTKMDKDIYTSIPRYFLKNGQRYFQKKGIDIYNDDGDVLLRAMLAKFFLLLCFQFRAVYLSNPCFLICSRSLIYSFCCKANKYLCK